MSTPRVGIIGCGGIAYAHRDGYRANGIEPIAFMDTNKAAAEALAKDVKNAKVFDTAQALIESGMVNVVSVCSPPAFHEEATVLSLRNGIHTLCEKPLAHTIESGKNIAAAAASSSALCMTAFRHRFLASMVKIRSLLDEDRIGSVVFFNNIFCGHAPGMKDKWFSKKALAGGGSMLDTSSHSADLFRFLVGEVAEQKAVTNRRMENADVEDSAVLIVKADNGAIGSMTSSWMAGTGEAYVDIMGEKGRIFYDYIKGTEVRVELLNGEPEVHNVEVTWGFKEEIEHFLGAIEGKYPLACTAHDGLRSLEIIMRCYS
ncbi:MAG TPA: Gfo/Idh/MocA family oxidoreductase [bacterium]|nr:Gfo/Idh/MocA family oxidoreductase [bacterium]